MSVILSNSPKSGQASCSVPASTGVCLPDNPIRDGGYGCKDKDRK